MLGLFYEDPRGRKEPQHAPRRETCKEDGPYVYIPGPPHRETKTPV